VLTVNDDDRSKRINRLKVLSVLLDSAFQIPGTKIRIGLDSILGLVPGIGDLTTSFFSIYLIKEAAILGVRPKALAHMVRNVVLDFSVGLVPILGDIFDVTWRSNKRNVDIALLDLSVAQSGSQTRVPSYRWIWWSVVMLALLAVGAVMIVIKIFSLF
jgi:hypothetical protein